MNDEEREARKSLLIRVGVSIIITIVFFLWAASLKGIFRSNHGQEPDSLFQNISEDIDAQMKGLEKKMNENQASTTQDNFVKELINKTDEAASSSLATSTAVSEIKKELADVIKENTASTTVNLKTNCPPFINCMPTIGENRPCVIPAGCENITQIAY